MQDLALTQSGTVSPGAPQLRSYFREVDERLGNRGMLELFSVSQSRGVIPRGEIADTEGRADSFAKYKVVRKGDIVLNRFNAYRGSLGIAPGAGIVSPDYAVIRPVGTDPRYFDYFFRCDEVANFMKSTMGGIGAQDPDSSGFSRIDLRKLVRLPVPFREEIVRVAVADFLERETAKIDALIAKQEQLITTLDERRQAEISNVIMKGLDKNSTVSTTLVDHYEATPSSWSWVRLKDVAEVTPSNVDKKTYEGDISVSLCNYVDVYYNEFISANLNFMSATATPDEIRKFELKRGWVIITKDSEDASDIGISAYVPEDLPNVVCGYHLSIVRPKVGVSGLFLKWFFDSTMTKGFMAKRANGLTRMALGQGAISTLPICLPPFAEQVEIANYLLETTTNVDDLLRTSRKTVDLLRERRQALISAAVTGKLEVGV